MNNTEKKFLAHKIWQLAEAFANLGEKFDSFDEEEIDDLISKDYPFDKSFDEMIFEVLEWRDTVADKVNWERNEGLKESKTPKRIKYKGQVYEAVGISQGWGSTLSPKQFDVIHLSNLLDKIYGDPRLYRIAYATQTQRDQGIVYSIAYKKDGVWKTALIKQEDIDDGLKQWANIYGPSK